MPERFATVGRLRGVAGAAHLFAVVQALVVILHGGDALLLARVVVVGAVDHIAREQLLPEGEAPGRACGRAESGSARCLGNANIRSESSHWSMRLGSPPFKPYPDAMVCCVGAWVRWGSRCSRAAALVSSAMKLGARTGLELVGLGRGTPQLDATERQANDALESRQPSMLLSTSQYPNTDL